MNSCILCSLIYLVWRKKKNQQYIFFSLSHSALEMLFPIKLSHLLRIVFVCNVTITEHTTSDGLKLNWIQPVPQREGQKIRRRRLYRETKRGLEKRGQGERAAGACFACTGASVGEGVDRAPQCCLQLSDNSCSERRDVLRVLRHVSLFLHLSFHLSASSSHPTDIRQTQA